MLSSMTAWGADGDAIVFADANVKDICVKQWDTDGDGELSEYEASVVTTLDKAFFLKADITAFDELKFFTGLTTIGGDDFTKCTALKSVTIPSGVTTIEPVAFANCPLESITVSEDNATLYSPEGSNAVVNRSTKELVKGIKTTVMPADVTAIGEGAFYTCTGLTAVTVPDGVTSIGRIAFSECENLASVAIPATVTAIGEMSFSYCKALTSVTIPGGVTQLGASAFWNCTALTSVTVEWNTPVSIDWYAFTNRQNATLTVPYGCTSAYAAAEYWKEFKQIVEDTEKKLWSGSQEIGEWGSLTLGADVVASLAVGDELHVEVKDVAEGATEENWTAVMVFNDGTWTETEASVPLAEDTKEVTFTLTGDVMRYIKTRGLVLTGYRYTITRVYAKPTGYTGSDNSVWVGSKKLMDETVGVHAVHWQNASGRVGLTRGDIIRLTYTPDSDDNWLRLDYWDSDWQWHPDVDVAFVRTATGADIVVTDKLADIINSSVMLAVQASGITLTQVELIESHQYDFYAVAEDETFVSGTTKTLDNITLTFGQEGGADFQPAVGSTCGAFSAYTPGNNVNGDKEGGTFYVFKPKKGGALTVVVRQNGGKALYVEEDGTALDGYNGLTPEESYAGGYTFQVKAGSTYKLYCSGSKLGLYGFVFRAVPSLSGDVNGSGEVNIVDVTSTISHILGQTPEDFNPEAADVDGNGVVNVVDVTTIIDMILKK